MSLRLASFPVVVALVAGCNSPSAGPDAAVSPDLAGASTVDHDGDGYSPAQGDCNDGDPATHPGAREVCGDHVDQNCDGVPDETCDDDHDGYAVVASGKIPGGDCNDDDRDPNAPRINPGAYDFAGNQLDDDCDGKIDNPLPDCDSGLHGADAPTLGESIGVCAPWLRSADLAPASDPRARKIAPGFGSKITASFGESLTVLSTGVARDEHDPDYVPVEPGTAFGGRAGNPYAVAATDACTGAKVQPPSTANDPIALSLSIRVPTNAGSFKFDWDYFSAEYPHYAGAAYGDAFIAWVEAKGQSGPAIVGADGSPLRVDVDYLDACRDVGRCGQKMGLCGMDADALDGTGYEVLDNSGAPMGASTGWFESSVSVTPGETIKLVFYLYDGGDGYVDSTVLLDGFEWRPITTPTPSP